jgi:hypothetical protein
LAARLASKGDEEGTQTGLETSIRIFGEHGYAYWTARAQSDLACWLHDRGRREEAEPLFTQAAEVFRRVGAVPDLSRMQGLGSNVER